MDINSFNAAKTYGAAQKTLNTQKSSPSDGGEESNGSKPAALAKEMAATVARSENVASAYMVGAADPHSVVEAIASAELAVETAVTLRNRVVEAYQELLRMPI